MPCAHEGLVFALGYSNSTDSAEPDQPSTHSPLQVQHALRPLRVHVAHTGSLEPYVGGHPGPASAQGWKVTDPQALADIGLVPDHETLIEIPEEVLKFYVRRYQQEGEDC
jgi:hypothetical protein